MDKLLNIIIKILLFLKFQHLWVTSISQNVIKKTFDVLNKAAFKYVILIEIVCYYQFARDIECEVFNKYN